MSKVFDLPPVWLALSCLLSWFGRDFPVPSWPAWVKYGGIALMILAVLTMVWAVAEMARRRTTPIPHQMPSALVSTGPFQFSRNPIYLGDAVFLAGFSLAFSSLIGLLLVPMFMVLITVRFIRDEESRLKEAFGDSFAEYSAATRRWL